MALKDYFNLFYSIKEKYCIRTSEDDFRYQFDEHISEEGSLFDWGDVMKGRIINNKVEILGKRTDLFKNFFISIKGVYKINSKGELELELKYQPPLSIEIIMKLSLISIIVSATMDQSLKAIICIPVLILSQFVYVSMVKEGKTYFEEYFLSSFNHVETYSDK